MKKTATLYVLSAVFFIALDRFFKSYALITDPDFSLLSGLLAFRYEENPFIAFSIPLSGIFLNIAIALIIATLLALAIHSFKNNSTQFFPLIFIIAGAVSNLYDRLVYGFVIDYFFLKYFTVFNIADYLIVVSAAYLVWQEFKSPQKKAL